MTDTKKILVFTAKYGGVHHVSAEALVAYYRGHCSDSVDVELVDFFEECVPNLGVLARFAYQQHDGFFPSDTGSIADLADALPANPVLNTLKQGGIDRAREVIATFDPHAVVSTCPVAGAVAADVGRGAGHLSATVLTDLNASDVWLHPDVALHFVASDEAREDLVVRGVPWERIIVAGVPVNEGFMDRADRTVCRKAYGLSERFTVVLTSMDAIADDAEHLVRQLAGLGIQVVVACGHNDRLRQRLESMAVELSLLRVFGFVEDMNGILRSADVVVERAGGAVALESLAVQVPQIICSPVPGQEVHNVDFAVNSGVGLFARDEEDIVEKVRFLSGHPDRLEQMAGNARSLGRSAAVQAVCERVLAEIR